MGGAGVASTDGAAAAYWNPSRLAFAAPGTAVLLLLEASLQCEQLPEALLGTVRELQIVAALQFRITPGQVAETGQEIPVEGLQA